MALRPGFGPAHPEFDAFLLAEIGNDCNGLPVTLQSALARLDRDPHTEAVRIYEQSREAAVGSLVDLIDAMPKGSWTKLDAREIAADLLTRLPHGRRRQAQMNTNRTTPRLVIRLSTPRLLIYAAFAALVAYIVWGMPSGSEYNVDLSSIMSGASTFAVVERVPAFAEGMTVHAPVST
jgi:hypothetical protein